MPWKTYFPKLSGSGARLRVGVQGNEGVLVGALALVPEGQENQGV